jgi:hypothetical protein
MDCAHCLTGMDYAVAMAAQIAKWLLMCAAATGVAIKLYEWRKR